MPRDPVKLPAVLETGGRRYTVQRAVEADVEPIVELLADDSLGARRESADAEVYLRAFRAIDADPQHLLIVLRGEPGKPEQAGEQAPEYPLGHAEEAPLLGTMQLTLIPGLSRAGATRLQIESVRLAASVRGAGVGTALFDWVHQYGRAHGASLAQLTTDRSRLDARRFYEHLGYAPSHDGMKRPL